MTARRLLTSYQQLSNKYTPCENNLLALYYSDPFGESLPAVLTSFLFILYIYGLHILVRDLSV